MSQQSKLIAAIDIGTTKIVAVAGLKHTNGQIEILGMESVPSTGVKRGVILNIEETVNAIKQVTGALEERLDVKIADVFVGIAGQHIKSVTNRCYRFIDEGDEITTFDLEQLLSESYRMPLDVDEKILHVIPQDYVVDHESGIKNPVGMSGQKIDGNFLVVIGRITSVRNIEKCIHRAGLKLNGLLLEPLASAGSVLSEEEKEAGVVLVDIGGGTTDLALFHDGIVRQIAVIPFGGAVITADIKEGCSVLSKQAESLKVRFGSALGTMAREDAVVTIPGIPGWEPKEISFKSLACIIQARMEEIIDIILHQIEKSGYYEKLGAGIVITGGGAQLNHAVELLKLKSGLDVRLGKPGNSLLKIDPEAARNPSYATTVGLIVSAGTFPGSGAIRDQSLFDDWQEPQPRQNVKKKPEKVKRKPNKDKKEYITGDLFSQVKRGLAGIFDDKDTDM